MSIVENILNSESLKASVLDYSNRWILANTGYLSIYDNLTDEDFAKLTKPGLIKGIAFGRKFPVQQKVLEGINEILLVNSNANYRLCLNGFDAFDDLEHLRYLSNLKRLRVNILNDSALDPINEYLSLEALDIEGENTDLSPLSRQKEINELSIGGKVRNMPIIASLLMLQSLSFRHQTLKSVEFLSSMDNLRTISFLLGGTRNFNGIGNISSLEKISFCRVNRLVTEDLLLLNGIQNLLEISLRDQPHIIDIKWLKAPELRSLSLFGLKGFKTLEGLSAFSQIEKFFTTEVPDGNLSEIFKLKKLKKLWLPPRIYEKNRNIIQRLLPNVEITIEQ